MTMKYLKYAVLCFLLIPMVVNANKYTLRGRNTKAEVIALGLEVRNASQDSGLNQVNAKAKFQTYEIKTGNFKPCQPDKVGVIFFMPPKGILFSADISERRKDLYMILVKDGESDSLIISISCPGKQEFTFALIE